MESSKKILWYNLAFMAFSTVWGFGNVLNGFVYFNGIQVIFSWVLMFALYFVPYALMVGELTDIKLCLHIQILHRNVVGVFCGYMITFPSYIFCDWVTQDSLVLWECPSASHAEEHQYDHHRNGDEAAAAASVSTTAATIVVAAATATRRTAEVAVEGRHVLGIARVTFTEIAVITVCHCIFLHPKCVLLHLRSFYRKRCPINLSFSIFCRLILPGFPDTHQCP